MAPWTSRIRFTIALAAIVFAAHTQSAPAAPAQVGDEFFEAKVRPLLAERCYKCHSATSEKLKGGLHLDTHDGLLRGGESGAAIVAGHPEQSRLITAIGYKDPDLQMPPKSKLSDEQIAVLTTWVAAGAPWPKGDAIASAPVAKPARAGFDLAQRRASHWAWQPIKVVPAPTVKNAGWARSNIDRFILAKLEEKGMTPAPPADRRTLIRRVTFDITGLPPTPADVRAFVDDASPEAFTKVIDRLLASPAYGERWARHWLDLVRYAETRGHEFDYDIPNAFQYRDYVIRALNADLPYDQFVTEHVAGDLLPKPRLDASGEINESIVGTGFWFLNEWLHSPVDIREDECNRIDNQIDVFGKAFLGMTIGCARCHDHKFDAIAQKDYYGLAGFLESTSFRDTHFMHGAHNRDVLRRVQALDRSAAGEVLRAVAGADKPVLDRLDAYLVAAREAMHRADGDVAAAVASVAEQQHLDADRLAQWVGEIQRAEKDHASPLYPWAVLSRSKDAAGTDAGNAIRAMAGDLRKQSQSGAAKSDAKLIVDYAHPQDHDWIADGIAFGDGPMHAGQVLLSSAAGAPPISVREVDAGDSASTTTGLPGMLRTPAFTISAPRLWYRIKGTGKIFAEVDSHRMLNGPLHGSTRRDVNTKGQWVWLSHDLTPYIGQRAHVEFTAGSGRGDALAVSSVWQGGQAPTDAAMGNAVMLKLLDQASDIASLAKGYRNLFSSIIDELCGGALSDDADAAERAHIANWMLSHPRCFVEDGPAGESTVRLLLDYQSARAKLLGELKDSPTAMAMLDGNGWDEHVLLRGSHKTPGEVVHRHLLTALTPTDRSPGESITGPGSGRLELAQEMTDAKTDPLLPRVMVNRVWHHLFGRGIVASVDNFGVLGEAPTHPELLDCLADQFVRDGWSTKRLIRSIVLSSTYQMSSQHDPAAEEADPQDLLLHRARVRRLEGEAIRDEILAVSGRLDPTMYGPSIDVHLTPFMDGRGKPAGGPLDGAGRRSIYVKVRRNFLPPMMVAFDTPAPFNCMGRRTVSNVPAQALTMLNDPFVQDQAKLWAQRVLAEKDLTPRQRITGMYQQAFARDPSAEEAAAAEAFLTHQGEALGIAPSVGPTDVRTWSDLAHVLMNVKEFIFIN